MYRKMTFWGVCMALAMAVGAPAVAADRVIGNIIVPIPSNGTNGAAGADGASAYQIWLNAGNTGTEADFLASLVGAPGTNGVDGAPGAACESTLTTTQCGPDLTQKCPVATKSGVIYTKTDCNNANPTQDVVYNGTDGATGAAGAACESTITSVVCGPNETVQCAVQSKSGVRIAKTDCNNENPTYDYVYDGADGDDGVGVCDGISSANMNKTVKNTTSVYTAATSSAAGYVTNTRTMCDLTTVTTDTVQDTCTQIVDTRTSGACDGAYMMCTNQTNNATYYVCKAVTGTNVSSISSAISSAQTAADNAQSTANNKVDTATFTSYQATVASTYANKDDVYNKTQVDNAISTATSGLASKTYVDNAVANKQDTLSSAQLAAVNSGITSDKITTYDGYATTIANKADASALTTANGKIAALEATVGDASSGLVQQVNTNTSAIGDTSSGLIKDVADAKASATSAVSTANTASANATQAKQDAASALSGLSSKLNTADFTSTANTWAGTQTTLAKQADLRTVEGKADQAVSDAETAKTNAATAVTNTETLNTTVYGSANGTETSDGLVRIVGKTASTGLRGTVATNTSSISSLDATVSEHTSNISSLDTTVSGHTTSISSLQSRASSLETTVNGTCSGSNDGRGSSESGIGSSGSGECTQSLETRIRALEQAVAALQNS